MQMSNSIGEFRLRSSTVALLSALSSALYAGSAHAADAPTDDAGATPPSEPLPSAEPAPSSVAPPDSGSERGSLAASPLLERQPNNARGNESEAMPPPAGRNPNAVRFEFGGRLGYGVPVGSAYGDQKLGDLMKGMIPLLIEGWLRVPGGFALGLYGQIGIGLDGPDLERCKDCSVADFRFGVQAAKHFNPYQTFDPWIGVGLGIEALSITRPYYTAAYDYRISWVYSAFPELMAQAGVDIGNEAIAFGPFASISYAVYTRASAELHCSGCNGSVTLDSGSIDDRSSHLWALVGVRGTYLR